MNLTVTLNELHGRIQATMESTLTPAYVTSWKFSDLVIIVFAWCVVKLVVIAIYYGSNLLF